MHQETLDHESRERDRQHRDRNVFGCRSFLASDLCQECGSEPGTGGMIAWYDEEEVRREGLCPYCHPPEETNQLDQEFHDILKDMNPALYDCIEQLAEFGYTPAQLARQTEKRTGKDSVLPGMVESTARIIRDRNG